MEVCLNHLIKICKAHKVKLKIGKSKSGFNWLVTFLCDDKTQIKMRTLWIDRMRINPKRKADK